MKTRLLLASAVAGLLSVGPQLSDPVWAQCEGTQGQKNQVTNAGTEFLLCFMENIDIGADPSFYGDIYLAALSDSAKITITTKADPSFSKVITLGPNQSLSYRISNDLTILMETDETIDKHPIHVVSTNPIVCYGMNHKQYSADAFLAFAKPVTGKEYRILSYPNSKFSTSAPEPSEFAVAAFEDSTEVEIVPTCTTGAGVLAGTPIRVTLAAGEGYQVLANLASDNNDLTGTIVRSNKNIAVFGGHVRAEVPTGYSLPDGSSPTSRDHLCEQLPPITTWGKSWVTGVVSPQGNGDIIRILALNDNTQVTINGTLWATLGANTYKDYTLMGPATIDANSQCLVGQFSHTTDTYLGIGDPFLIIVPPVDQTYNDFTFFISTDPSYTTNRLNVAVDARSVSQVTLDGAPVTAPFTTLPNLLGGKQYAVAAVDVPRGSHRLTTGTDPNLGATIVGYGYGPADSYGYAAGSLLKPLFAIHGKQTGNTGIVSSPVAELTLHNVLGPRAWVDSARILVNGELRTDIKLRERIWQDFGDIGGNETRVVHVTANHLDAPVTGMLEIYHHTFLWEDLETSVIPFTLAPATLGVTPDPSTTKRIALYPNPSRDRVMIGLGALTNAHITVRNALGVVSMESDVTNTNMGSLDIRGLAAGAYWVEIRSNGKLLDRLPLRKPE